MNLRIALFGKPIQSETIQFIQNLIILLHKHQILILVYEEIWNTIKNNPELKDISIKPFFLFEDIKNKIDFLFSIGGDGTFLEAITLIRNTNTPVLGINTGRLGFLSCDYKDEMEAVLTKLKQNNFSIQERSLLSIETINDHFGSINFALNEITIQKKDTSTMLTIHTYVNNEFLNSYWADGLIIATPTGSTGYSMSCNGPIIAPESKTIIINPIASHNLSVRPLVIPDNMIIKCKIESRQPQYLVVLDSRSSCFNANEELIIRKENFSIKVIHFKDESFFKTLRNKLMWGKDKRNY